MPVMLRTAAPARVLEADGPLVTTAVLRAATRLGVSNRALARILGLSEATVSRMGSGAYTLGAGDKPFELAVYFLRLFRSLDAIVGGDESAARGWLERENAALGGAPVKLIQSLQGLIDVVEYLDARRALV